MRLIDADALDFGFDRRCFCEADEGFVRGADEAIAVVENAPTVDAVEIVRCKDCTEWDEKERECSHWYGFRENDFCSYGVAKMDGKGDG